MALRLAHKRGTCMDMSKVGLGLGDLVDKLCEAKESLLANEIVETASTV